MIESTFCHLPGISLAEEKDLWRKNLRTWDDLLCWAAVFTNDDRYSQLKKGVADSQAAVASQSPEVFLRALPESEWYRTYHDFPAQMHCVAIETNGLDENREITCISILTAGRMHSFIGTDDLESAAASLAKIRIAVTFNETQLDIPRLMRRFSRFLPKYHVDLARILGKQRIRGNLTDGAARLGWTQDGKISAIANGEEAAEAWANYEQSGDQPILEMLRAYSQKDVRRLEFILRVLVRRHVLASMS